MEVGDLPKGLNSDEVCNHLGAIAAPGEEFSFAFEGVKVNMVVKIPVRYVIAVSNIRTLVLSAKDLHNVKWEILRKDTTKFTLMGIAGLCTVRINYNGNLVPLEFLVADSDRKKLKKLNSLDPFVNPSAKSDYSEKKQKALREKIEQNRNETENHEQARRNIGHSNDEIENFGNVAFVGKFGSGLFKTRIEFFEKGWVSVNGASPERLISISGQADVSKKSGIGRAVGGVATFGLNFDASTSMRGNIYLTIITDAKAHTLEVDLGKVSGHQNPVQDMNEIVAAGTRVLHMNDSGKDSNDSPSRDQKLDVSLQLEKLAQLHETGALSDDEFASAKQRILES